jgi:hypothetical protein
VPAGGGVLRPAAHPAPSRAPRPAAARSRARMATELHARPTPAREVSRAPLNSLAAKTTQRAAAGRLSCSAPDAGRLLQFGRAYLLLVARPAAGASAPAWRWRRQRRACARVYAFLLRRCIGLLRWRERETRIVEFLAFSCIVSV